MIERQRDGVSAAFFDPTGLPARPRDRRPVLRLDQLDPCQRPRSPTPDARFQRTRAAARPSQHPRFPLLPLRRQTLLTHPTIDQLVKLGLAGMARAFTELQDNQSAAGLGHAEWLALLLDREATERSNRQLTATLRHARLRQRATIEDIDYRATRGLDRTLFQRLRARDWIDVPQNLIIEGPTGVGKSWLACALGNKACRDNRSVLYQRVPKLFPDLALARGDGRHPRLLRALGRVDLLILDDWGLEPLDAAARHDLLEILEDRYGRH